MSLRSWLGITKGRERRVKKGKKIFIICLYLMAIIGSIAFIFPFIWVVSTSLKETAQTYTFPPELIPDPVSWRNYYRIWTEIPFSLFYRNSLFVILTAPLGAVITTSLVAYPFARLRFRGRNFLFILILSTLMVPPQILIIPRFLLFKSIGWLDTLKPLIIPYCLAGAPGAAFNIFLFRQFYMTIPFELDEAAKIDGAGMWNVLRYITLPMLKPIILVAVLLRTMDAFKWFDTIYIMTSGGPGIATETASLYSYLIAFNFFNIGKGSAFSIIMIAIVILFCTFYIRMITAKEHV